MLDFFFQYSGAYLTWIFFSLFNQSDQPRVSIMNECMNTWAGRLAHGDK